MRALAFNFVRRAIIVPVVVTALLLAVLMYMAPRQIAQSAANVNTVYAGGVSLASFNTVDYDSFSALTEDAFVGTLSCEALEMPAVAVLNGTQNNANIGMAENSAEPWGSNSGILLIGMNTVNQLKYLHSAAVGNEFTFSFYGNGNYRYAVERVVPNCAEDDLDAYCEEGTLVLCLPYNDVSSEDAPALYLVCVAREVQG